MRASLADRVMELIGQYETERDKAEAANKQAANLLKQRSEL